jgi:hypothetical protein
MWIDASVEMTRLMWIDASVEMTGSMLHTNHQVIPQTHRSLWKHLSFRPEWRSHGAEKSRVSRASDLSITSPSVTSVEMTRVNMDRCFRRDDTTNVDRCLRRDDTANEDRCLRRDDTLDEDRCLSRDDGINASHEPSSHPADSPPLLETSVISTGVA